MAVKHAKYFQSGWWAGQDEPGPPQHLGGGEAGEAGGHAGGRDKDQAGGAGAAAVAPPPLLWDPTTGLLEVLQVQGQRRR
jgi:hypothetical protein